MEPGKEPCNPTYLVWLEETCEYHDGRCSYAFFFSRIPDNVNGPGWDKNPVYIHAGSPHPNDVHRVLEYTLPSKLFLIHERDGEDRFHFLSYLDVAENLVAMAWEELDDVPEKQGRLVFQYGDEDALIIERMRERGIERVKKDEK